LHLDSLALEWISKVVYGASPNLGAVYIDTVSVNEDLVEKDLLIIDAKFFGKKSGSVSC
jgi:hypothetical protein